MTDDDIEFLRWLGATLNRLYGKTVWDKDRFTVSSQTEECPDRRDPEKEQKS